MYLFEIFKKTLFQSTNNWVCYTKYRFYVHLFEFFANILPQYSLKYAILVQLYYKYKYDVCILHRLRITVYRLSGHIANPVNHE